MAKILTETITNKFEGHKIALFTFVIVVIFTIVRSLIHVFSPDGGAGSIAGIPLETYNEAASASVIMIFSLWGLAQLIMGIFYAIVLVKYKSLIPLMYIFLAFEYAMRIVIGQMKPIETLHTAPGEIGNYIMIPLALIMLYLSLRKDKSRF